MRKPAFCKCEDKDTDQRRGKCAADRCLCFRYIDSTIPLLTALAIFCDCTGWFVSNLVGNSEDRFSRDAVNVWLRAVRGHLEESANMPQKTDACL